MSNELKKRNAHLEELEKRIKYCEEVARQYELMFKQLESKLKVLADREGNIQQLYEYMTRLGSQLSVKNPNKTAFLLPLREALSKDDKKYLEAAKKFKFQVGEEVYYADEALNRVSWHRIEAIDVIGKHPRYRLEYIFGYIDESKLFETERRAQRQLDEWKSGVKMKTLNFICPFCRTAAGLNIELSCQYNDDDLTIPWQCTNCKFTGEWHRAIKRPSLFIRIIQTIKRAWR